MESNMKAGTKHSEEAKQRMRLASLGNGNTPPSRKGITFTMSQEHKERIRQSLLGKKHTLERRKNQSLAKLGKEMSDEFKQKLSIRNKKLGIMPPLLFGEQHGNWKGDKVGYVALHMWVARHLGKPDTCEYCGRTGLKGRQIHWANKSGKYCRDLTDWLRLCVPCHSAYDLGKYQIHYA